MEVQSIGKFLIQSGYAEKKKFNASNKQTIRVDFRYPFKRAPLIQIGFTALDDWDGGQLRLQANVAKVHTHYCEIQISTWYVSKIWWGRVQWTAFGESVNEISEEELNNHNETIVHEKPQIPDSSYED